GTRNTHGFGIRCAMNINVTALGIHVAATIDTALLAAQPEDAGENPVTIGKRLRQIRTEYLTGRAAGTKHRIQWLPLADLGANAVPAQWRLVGTRLVARPLQRRGNRPAGNLPTV